MQYTARYTESTSDLKRSLGKVIKLVLIVVYMVNTTPVYNFLRNFGHFLLQISNILYFFEIVADKQRIVQSTQTGSEITVNQFVP